MNTPHTSFSAPRAARGFTLTELMVVLSIASVLITMAVPMITGTVNMLRMRAAADEFVAHLYLARSEAIKRNTRTVICKSADGETCASSGGWDQGWIVFHDADNDGKRTASEAVIRRFQGMSKTLSAMGNLNVAKYVSFHPNGEARLTSGAFQAGTVTICTRSELATRARQVVINAVGRPRVQSATVADCA